MSSMDDQLHLTDFITTETKEHQLRTQNLLYMILELERSVIKKRAEVDIEIANMQKSLVELQKDYAQKLIEHERSLRKWMGGLTVGVFTFLTTIDTLFNIYK